MTTSIILSLATIGGAGFAVLFLLADTPNQIYAENSIHASLAISQTREYTIIAQDTTLEIAPGVRVEAWTFNGTVPGPTIRATEGDRVIIHFINESHLPHTIHLHGDHNEINDGVFQEVLPGGTYTYDFIAEPAGALMYHCHVMPVSQHVRNGLYGALIVDPKEKLEPAREYVIVKGEYDLEDQEVPFPDYVFFNGYADQYWNSPLPVRTGELVRVYYIDMGAMPAFGFHIHGTIFDAIPSGILGNAPVKVQTWEVSPGNAAIFEAKWDEPGRYLFHIHGIPEERGTMGYFNVVDVPNNAVDGVDVAKTKSIYMWEWEKNQFTDLQKSDSTAKITKTSVETSGHMMHDLLATDDDKSTIVETTSCEIEKNAALQTSSKSFYPKTIRVNRGDTVKWENKDSGIHTVTSLDGSFDSGMILSGQSFENTFEQTGTFDYFCALHPWMRASVLVT
ncbi:multicopper oxidase domain-containing protein [Candidatus Nitrosotenuis sp. DW1]|uniref:multicopper oxidase domain-containing protein n=1 Tax=Candidatus Nitrosotenuis sp. DW1 TaxID=2259672 RepID=UPI0015CC0B1C|nr:multicopper oxidase domain-containing protein [Candidatus Nitrosotenuis sp. DW1]QLH09956.1 copper oxidase [Candidatus Nitrosotenuis sp. DW1]